MFFEARCALLSDTQLKELSTGVGAHFGKRVLVRRVKTTRERESNFAIGNHDVQYLFGGCFYE